MSQSNMPLGAKDIKILLLGIGIMLVGFFVMTLDKEEFGFGFLGLTLGPILVLVGIIIPVFSLFKWKR
ncbi:MULTISPECIES: DUF3098 domain-containing protein [Aquirufa]|jgi:hypothetical protein|uniref:DUF3098 domain-containing protein n=2 Tax=Aquirufa TaxID=2676247 RepID=A0A4Q9BBM0_9BACT|nr:DUF3098 domain-containing protein [Aquirufa antheringensis]MCE4216499.1 DUF3098 domain-containing protein [Pseudarcicella sp. GAP-15]MCL9968536.1 DUF3098 domain-containing protein [Aquirufa antheringensis]MCZ2476791.1 DUF3098 domain-containing protein [Aquirufa antheringensis]MCZ2485995.1 DUF3098 domain-containing protein [Aquirufa antheringensis]MCZ2486314.1 DUF3098 domain-containing protein [Aquirufa antheringensis]